MSVGGLLGGVLARVGDQLVDQRGFLLVFDGARGAADDADVVGGDLARLGRLGDRLVSLDRLGDGGVLGGDVTVDPQLARQPLAVPLRPAGVAGLGRGDPACPDGGELVGQGLDLLQAGRQLVGVDQRRVGGGERVDGVVGAGEVGRRCGGVGGGSVGPHRVGGCHPGRSLPAARELMYRTSICLSSGSGEEVVGTRAV
ncbi:MAG: hypothetical protein KY469_15545 [Actinobacteria bacterium]|nr:hypothetical protein [Actinomycetota bacterium]